MSNKGVPIFRRGKMAKKDPFLLRGHSKMTSLPGRFGGFSKIVTNSDKRVGGVG